jgi:hypothetical protein
VRDFRPAEEKQSWDGVGMDSGSSGLGTRDSGVNGGGAGALDLQQRDHQIVMS